MFNTVQIVWLVIYNFAGVKNNPYNSLKTVEGDIRIGL